MERLILLFIATILIPLPSSLLAQENKGQRQEKMLVRFPSHESENDTRRRYEAELLRRALEVTRDEFGDYKIVRPTKMSEGKVENEFENGNFDVYHRPLMKMLNQTYAMEIRVPVLKGTLGYRIFLIHEDDQQKFANIKTLEQLKKLKVGQGEGWGDNSIFKHNDIKVVTGPDYEGLFEMLVHGRFDYFSRGISEAPHEYADRKDRIPKLWVEKSILLIYPYPVYFYVHKNAPEKTKERLEKGLRMMINDGSFDKLFWEYNGESIKEANLKGRKIFRIKVPNMPTLPTEKKLWYDPLQDYGSNFH